jgi:hypothetical protein
MSILNTKIPNNIVEIRDIRDIIEIRNVWLSIAIQIEPNVKQPNSQLKIQKNKFKPVDNCLLPIFIPHFHLDRPIL